MAADGDGYVSHPAPVARAGDHPAPGRDLRLRAVGTGRRGGFCASKGVFKQDLSGCKDRNHHPAWPGGHLIYPAAGAAGPGAGEGVPTAVGVRLYPDEPPVWDLSLPEAPGAAGAAGLLLLPDPPQAGGPCDGGGGGGGQTGQILGCGPGTGPPRRDFARLYQIPGAGPPVAFVRQIWY